MTTLHTSGGTDPLAFGNKPFWRQPAFPVEGRWTVARQDMYKYDLDQNSYMQQALDAILEGVDPVGWPPSAFYRKSDGSGLVPPLPGPYTPPYRGQTWPIRLHEDFHANIETVTEDQQSEDSRLLEAMLRFHESRNFFYSGHGGPETLMAHGGKPLLVGTMDAFIQHRYRFVFLFACQTLPGGWPAAFGIDETEPLPIEAYQPPSLRASYRPGVFVGFNSPIPVKSDEYYGLDTHGYDRIVSQEQAFFLSNFMFFWHPYGMGRGLENAIENAKTDLPDDHLKLRSFAPDGTVIRTPYHAWDCLKIWGYKDMKFNEYNQATY